MITTVKKNEILALTGIRGAAALWVLMFHFAGALMYLLPASKFLQPLAIQGYLGVDVFFVLSGFIMSYVYESVTFDLQARSYGHFIWNRFSRIYPNHLAMLFVLALLVLAAHLLGVAISGDYPLAKLPFQLLMVHAWPNFDGGAWNYPSWSISAEWFAYMIVFPCGVMLIQKKALRNHPWLWIGLAVAAYFILSRTCLQGPKYHALLQVTCEFSAGMGAYLIYRNHVPDMKLVSRWLPLLAVLLLCLYYSPWSAGAAALTICGAPLIVIGLAESDTRLARVLGAGPMLWLGRISYALYMSHAVVLKILKIAVPSEHFAQASLGARLAIFCAYLLAPLLGAALLYYTCEIPAQRYLRKLIGPVSLADKAKAGNS